MRNERAVATIRISAKNARIVRGAFAALLVMIVAMSGSGCTTPTLHEPQSYAAALRLTNAGADLNATNALGQTPVESIVRGNDQMKESEKARVLSLYLSRGASANPHDNQGRTPLSFCSWSSPMTKALLSYGADPYAIDTNGVSAISSRYKPLYEGKQKTIENIALIEISIANQSYAIPASIVRDESGKTLYDGLELFNKHDESVFAQSRFQLTPGKYDLTVVLMGLDLPVQVTVTKESVSYSFPEKQTTFSAIGGKLYMITSKLKNGVVTLSIDEQPLPAK